MSEIAQRLKSVTNGAPTQEFTLRRNQLGQLGFHVQHDGLITEVENFGYAWQTGLRQGSRLVEVRPCTDRPSASRSSASRIYKDHKTLWILKLQCPFSVSKSLSKTSSCYGNLFIY